MKDNIEQEIEMRSTKDLIPYVRNTRTHSEEQVGQIAASIKEFGFTNPVLVDQDNMIIAGHGRVMAANKLDLKEVPTIRLDYLTEAQKRAYVIADNRLALNADWDYEMLKVELKELDDLEFDVNLLGFEDKEIDDLLAEPTEGLVDEDEVPDLPDEPTTKLGDLWILGEHRLLCGDSTSIDAVYTLMDGHLADMVFTDPPYNVDYEGRGETNKLGKIKNDSMSDDDFTQFCRDFFNSYHIVMKPLASIYVCHPDSASAPKIAFETTFAEMFKKSSTIIWVKQSAGMGWQDYRAQHEPILYGWKEGKGSHYFVEARDKTTIWNISRDAQSSYVHPTQKPVALPEEAILNSTKGQDIVVDLFLGSGSTLIACDKSLRKCYGMELDPKYCDVIINRWQDFTGKEAVHLELNKTYNELNEHEND
tara:strand:+ start:371 stop:1630 length:1260 start_codon:yes stop_codon:yes gene_type:complete